MSQPVLAPNLRDGLRAAIVTGIHASIADETERSRGPDAGPAPSDRLLAALGACTSMTVRFVARRTAWPNARVTTLVDRRPATRAASLAAHATGAKEQIDLQLSSQGPLDVDRRPGSLEEAERCPVHRALAGGIRISNGPRPIAPSHQATQAAHENH